MSRTPIQRMVAGCARGVIIAACLLEQTVTAEAGSLIFRNYGLLYDGTQLQPTNIHPVLLSDCVTRAAGSNYVVELLAPNHELLATTYLRNGPYAGLFGGAWDYVSAICCHPARVRS